MKLRFLSYFVLAILILTYIMFILIRPYEDDESLYILSGKAILQRNLNPFKIAYQGHYSNPFQYIMGSPIAPMICGFGYLIGGIIVSRIFSMIFVIMSLFIVYKLTNETKGNAVIALIFAGFSSSVILLSSDSLLDSISLFFCMLSLFFINKRAWFFGGFSAGLTVVSKFFAIVPIIFISTYVLIKKRNTWKFFLGLVIVVSIFAIMYNQLIKTLLNFIIVEKINTIKLENLKNLLVYLAYFPPIIIIICLLNLKNEVFRKYFIFLIPAIALFSFHILTTNYQSLLRQLPFAEFPASILLGNILVKLNKRTILLIAGFLIINLYSASVFVSNYPSYNVIENKLKDVNGRILALNPHAFTLAKRWDINATEDNVFSYYYFDYKSNETTNDLNSTMEDYETALVNNFFDYAVISSYSPPEYPKYVQIENLVRKYYCSYFKQNKPNGIDIYKKCVR